MNTQAPLLIVIQGAPGTGKTTLSRRLEKDLEVPLIAKDDIKEFLFDRLVQSDRAFSRLQGEASVFMMYAAARSFLKAGKSIIIESAFFTQFAKKDVADLLNEVGARGYEIYVHCDEDVRRERFLKRIHDGDRHPGHIDYLPEDPSDASDKNRYVRIGLVDYSEVDTTSGLTDDAYASILREVRKRL